MQRILIVDDEPNIVLALEILMKKEGYEVRTVSDGEKALASIKEFRPHVVLLDIMMPALDGYEVCRIIRSDPSLNGTRIIMITAKGRDVEREKGIALGADRYISKPFSTREVATKVREVLMEEKAR